MNRLTAVRLDRDRELSADIVPEAYFKCSAIRELSYPWAELAFERQFTEVRAAWTDKYLYVHLWAKDGWMVKDDCLEVFLQPDSQWYRVWSIQASGTCVECRVAGWGSGPIEQQHLTKQGKPQAQCKVRKHDAGWVVEMRIPFAKDLGRVPNRGEAWPATFTRTDVDRQGRSSLSTFSTLASDSPVWFHQPSGFGQIIFG